MEYFIDHFCSMKANRVAQQIRWATTAPPQHTLLAPRLNPLHTDLS